MLLNFNHEPHEEDYLTFCVRMQLDIEFAERVLLNEMISELEISFSLPSANKSDHATPLEVERRDTDEPGD